MSSGDEAGVMVRLMFVDKSRPLAHSGVRFPEQDGAEYETDGEGRIRVELEPGEHRVEVETSDGWVEREFTLESDGGLVVVDLRDSNGNVRQTRQYFDTGGDRDLGDRYEFLGELGRGGMGVVVRARDTLLNRDVAIKILTPELQGSEEAERIFLTEARSMAKLSHANLVAVHDVISEGGHSMMVVEFITGQNLEEVIDEKGSLSQKAVINIGIQVCRVIDYLHSEGVIHRDLKPANLMIEGDGTVKLIDFGLARSLEQIANRGTKIRGTPAYMAPEQVLGDDLSAATDIYQIGVTLFEALTGELPFARGDVAYQHVYKEPPTTEEAGNNIFPALAELVDSCLAKDPADRPESARALMEELQAVKEVLTTGRISAVQLSDAVVADDSAGQPASTAQPAEIAQTTGAATGEGSLPEVSADGPPQEVADSDDTDAPASAGPSRWIWPAVAALFLVVAGAFLYADQLVGGEPEQPANSDEEKARAKAAKADEEPDPAAPDPSEAILTARAVSSAGQVVQSANAAARAVVEWVPEREEPGAMGAPPQRGGASGNANESAPQSSRGSAEPKVVEDAERGASPAAERRAEQTETSSKSDASDSKTARPANAEKKSETNAQKPIDETADSSISADTSEKSEAESPSSASSSAETTLDGTDEPKTETTADTATTSEPSNVVSESDTDSSKKEDDEKNRREKNEREERSAPVSF